MGLLLDPGPDLALIRSIVRLGPISPFRKMDDRDQETVDKPATFVLTGVHDGNTLQCKVNPVIRHN